MGSRLYSRVVKLEEARQRRLRYAPYALTSPDGRVTATVAPLLDRPACVVVRFDAAMPKEERDEAIAALPLPSPCALYLFPAIVEDHEAWQAAFAQYQQSQEPGQEN